MEPMPSIRRIIQRLGGRAGIERIAQDAQAKCYAEMLRRALRTRELIDEEVSDLMERLHLSGASISRLKSDPVDFLLGRARSGYEINDLLLRLNVDPKTATPSRDDIKLAVARATLEAVFEIRHSEGVFVNVQLNDQLIARIFEMADDLEIAADIDSWSDEEWSNQLARAYRQVASLPVVEKPEHTADVVHSASAWLAIEQLLPYQLAILFWLAIEPQARSAPFPASVDASQGEIPLSMCEPLPDVRGAMMVYAYMGDPLTPKRYSDYCLHAADVVRSISNRRRDRVSNRA